MWRNGARKPGPTVVGARPSNNESDAPALAVESGAAPVSCLSDDAHDFAIEAMEPAQAALFPRGGARRLPLDPPPQPAKVRVEAIGQFAQMTDVTMTSLRSAPLFFREDATLQLLYCLTPPCLPSKLPPHESKGFGRGRRPKGV